MPGVEDDLQRLSCLARVDLEALYAEATCAIEQAVLNSATGVHDAGPSARRSFDTLKAFAVIIPTRGGRT